MFTSLLSGNPLPSIRLPGPIVGNADLREHMRRCFNPTDRQLLSELGTTDLPSLE